MKIDKKIRSLYDEFSTQEDTCKNRGRVLPKEETDAAHSSSFGCIGAWPIIGSFTSSVFHLLLYYVAHLLRAFWTFLLLLLFISFMAFCETYLRNEKGREDVLLDT